MQSRLHVVTYYSETVVTSSFFQRCIYYGGLAVNYACCMGNIPQGRLEGHSHRTCFILSAFFIIMYMQLLHHIQRLKTHTRLKH